MFNKIIVGVLVKISSIQDSSKFKNKSVEFSPWGFFVHESQEFFKLEIWLVYKGRKTKSFEEEFYRRPYFEVFFQENAIVKNVARKKNHIKEKNKTLEKYKATQIMIQFGSPCISFYDS